MRGAILALWVAFFAVFGAGAAEDPGAEVPRLLDEAKARYAAGERRTVLDLLERATGAVRAELGELLAARLPDETAGFAATGPAEVQFPRLPGAPAGIVVRRRYEGGGATIEVEVYRDAPFAQGVMGLAGMAALFSGQPGVRRTLVGGQEMVWLWKAEERRAEGMLAAGTTMLVVRGDGLGSPEAFDAFLKALAPVLEPLP